MKSFLVNGSDPAKQEKFLAYMVPSPHELSKDLDDETEDIQYSWLREYHWEVCGYFLLFLLSSLKKEKKC
jgi:RNA polymerase II-associated factor 1